MNAARIRVGLAVGFLGLALTTGSAAAQQLCTESECKPTTTTTSTSTTSTTEAITVTTGDELGTGVTAPPGGETGGETGGAPGGVEPGNEQQPQEGETETVGEGGQAAPEGTLPFTGGDVAGLVLIGGAAITGGALLLRRSKATA